MSQLSALLWSIVIEAVAAAIVVNMFSWGSGLRAANASALATLATHWLAWDLMLRLVDSAGYWPTMIGIESAVIASEAMVYRWIVPLSPRRALLTSLIANFASAGTGIALDLFDALDFL